MTTAPRLVTKLGTAARIARRGVRDGWRLALLEHYLAMPGGRPERVRQLLPSPGRHLLVACMPKSGSTFLAAALAAATGFEFETLSYGYEQNEQDLYLPALVRICRRNTVTQQHMRASDPNVRLIDSFGLTPIVLVRSLPDVVVSLFDHLHRTALKASMAYVNEQFFELDRTAQIDLIVELFMPWYVSFYVSWWDAEARGKCPVIWVRYEDVIADNAATMERILAAAGVARDRDAIQRGIAHAKSGDVKLNKGVTGRGREFLSDAQRAHIAGLARHYPWVDFSRILPA